MDLLVSLEVPQPCHSFHSQTALKIFLVAKSYTYTIVAAASCALLALYFINPIDYVWMPKCPVKMIFGIDCPGCGFQRAVHALLHGRIIEAVGYNLFLVVALPYLMIILLSDYMREGKLRQKLRSAVECKWVTNGYIIFFFLWFLVRNIIKC